jgi:hypothetical protein
MVTTHIEVMAASDGVLMSRCPTRSEAPSARCPAHFVKMSAGSRRKLVDTLTPAQSTRASSEIVGGNTLIEHI